MGNLAGVHADLDTPAIGVLLRAAGHLDVVLAVVLALVEDVVDVVRDHGALHAEVVLAVRGAQVHGRVVRAADPLALVRRAHVAVRALPPEVLLALHEVLAGLLAVDVLLRRNISTSDSFSLLETVDDCRPQGLAFVSGPLGLRWLSRGRKRVRESGGKVFSGAKSF